MSRGDPHLIDERYDGVLTALALSGGLAALGQLEAYLGSDLAVAALMREVRAHRLGRSVMLPGGTQQALLLRRTPLKLLLGRPVPRPLMDWSQYVTVQRFEYRMRTGRPLHPAGWLSPEQYARGEVPHPEAAEQMWRAMARLESVFVDLHPDLPRLVVVEQPAAERSYDRLIAALATVGTMLGVTIELRMACSSDEQAERTAARLDAAGVGEGLPVNWAVVDLSTAHYFDSLDDVPTERPMDAPPPPDETMDAEVEAEV